MIRNLLSLFFINGFITMCNLKKCFIYAWHFEYSCNTQSRLTNLFFATLRQIARLWQALLLCDNVCVNWFDSSWKIFGQPKGRNCSFEGGFLTKNGSANCRRTCESVTQIYLIILLLKASWIHMLSKQLFHVRIREVNKRSKHIPLGDHSLD